MAGFSQDIFEGISGLKFLSTDTLNTKNVFVWQNDTIQKDSIVYADINNDCIRFHYIDGNWTKWFCNSDIEKVVNHVHNDQDTIKTNELITNVTFQNDTLKIIEQGFTWKVKIQNVETDPVFNSWNKDYNDLTNKPTLFSGDYNDLTNKPTLFDGNYNSLTNKPTLFDGAYSSLTGKPTLLSQFTNDPGFLTSYTETDPTIYSWAKASTKPSYTASEVSALPNNATVTINGATKNLSTNPSFSISGGNAINAFYNQIAVSSNPISVTWPSSMGDTNYFLNIRAWYDNTVSGKTVQIANAVYDFTKTANGFSMSLDTIAGYVEYFAADTTNLYPMSFSNYLTPNDVVTTVGNPGADYNIPTEKAVRTVVEANKMIYPSAGIAVSNGSTWSPSITDNHINWDKYNQWDGGSSGLNATTGRTSLGGTVIGQNLFILTNPSAVTFPRFNADNTVSPLSASDFRSAIGAGTMTSVISDTSPNLGGNLIVNQKNINFTASLSTNQSYSGLIESGTVGENVVFGDVLYLKFSDGKWWKAKADAYSTTPATRMALASISANASGLLLIEGNIRYDSWTFAANKVYLSAATSGAITTTQPSATGNKIQALGIAKTSTTMYFKPSLDVGEK